MLYNHTENNSVLCPEQCPDNCDENGVCKQLPTSCPEQCPDNCDENGVCHSYTTNGKVVISQIYTGGGNSGAIYKNKYIELFNPGTSGVDISGWSLQYGVSDKDTVASVCTFPENTKIPRGGYALVALNSGSNGDALPKADISCTHMNPAAAKGKLFLVNHDELLPSSLPDYGYVDAIGYGTANWAEGGNPASALSAKTAALRKDDGCTDTDNNGDDFDVASPSPRNSHSPVHLCNNTEPTPDPACGNGVIESGEDCDQDNLNGKSCTSWPEFVGGTLVCKSSCKYTWALCHECTHFDATKCKSGQVCYAYRCVDGGQCGNGVAEINEYCDGSDLKGATSCTDYGYAAGTLKCKADCSGIDKSSCLECTDDSHCAERTDDKTKCTANKCVKPETFECGNSIVETGEDCDKNSFRDNKTACTDWDSKYRSGSASCDSSCKIDLSACSMDAPECTDDYAECIEKEFSIKECVHGKYVTRKCPEDKPYCKTGEEACSSLSYKDPCLTNEFIPHSKGKVVYLCPIKEHAPNAPSVTYSSIDSIYGSSDCIHAKRGYGVALNDETSCHTKGASRLKHYKLSYYHTYDYYACQKCKVAQNGELYWMYVPATYTVTGGTLSCEPWEDVE